MKSRFFKPQFIPAYCVLIIAFVCLPVLASLKSPIKYLILPLHLTFSAVFGNVNHNNDNPQGKAVSAPGLASNKTTTNSIRNSVLVPAASNGKLAFNGGGKIFTVNPDGTNQINISNNNDGDVLGEWSPDGSKIVFSSENNGNIDIYAVNANGSNKIRLTTDSATDETPSWSPDGSKIVFASDRSGHGLEIYLMNADGTNQSRVTNAPGFNYFPKFSPDGNRIAFVSDRSGNSEIWVINADGTNAVNLTNDAADDFEPTWSPDGAQIAFTSFRSGSGKIWVMNSNGGNFVSLTDNTADDYLPAWSPDGMKIAFTSNRDGDIGIYSMNSNGGNQTRLTIAGADNYNPSWQPVFFHDVAGNVTYGTSPSGQTAKVVSGVTMTASGASSVAASSDSNGAYLLSNLTAGGEHTITASKTGNVNGITPFDATLVLRCVAAGAAGCTLTDNQKLAADTNNSDSITPFDATQILRFVAANQQTSATGQVGNWKFAPDLRTYQPLSTSLSNENYEAILIGEINGSWTPTN
jgi:Tol biopolymer transport system component